MSEFDAEAWHNQIKKRKAQVKAKEEKLVTLCGGYARADTLQSLWNRCPNERVFREDAEDYGFTKKAIEFFLSL